MKSQPSVEPILEPELPIIDAHHHMWLQFEAALAALDAQDTIISRSIGPNAYKRLTAGASNDEKAALFSGTATRIYRLALA